MQVYIMRYSMINNITNIEKYAEELAQSSNAVCYYCRIICNYECKSQYELYCHEINKKFIQWCRAKYENPLPRLTYPEYDIIKGFKYGYVCRDLNGTLRIYSYKPHKDEVNNEWITWYCNDFIYPLEGKYFKFIKWSDKDPYTIKELKKLEIIRY